jgi:hypothetical protein
MAGKSLAETAKSVLLGESNDPTPDREAKKTNPNMSTLRPNAAYKEGRYANPGAPSEGEFSEYEDLGPALVRQGDVPPSAKAVRGGRNTSKAAQSSVAGEPMKKLSNKEELDEEIEISEELQKFIENCLEEGMSEDEIEEAISENFEIIDETENNELEYEPVDMSEHVNALLQGENLSEGFKAKATTIFESAVKSVVDQEITVLEEAYAQSLQEQVENIYNSLSEEVEDYLSYVTEQWIEKNEVAIESGLRTEITEGFISGLRSLFAEHYINVPEDQVNVVDELGAQVQELQAKINEEIEKNVNLNKVLGESKRFEIMVSAMDGLTNTEAERLKALVEGIEFTNENEYASKISTLRESYFPTTVSNSHVLDPVESNQRGMISEENLSGPMAAYVRSLGKTRLK